MILAFLVVWFILTFTISVVVIFLLQYVNADEKRIQKLREQQKLESKMKIKI